MPPVKLDGVLVSSSAIVMALFKGDMDRAYQLQVYWPRLEAHCGPRRQPRRADRFSHR
jgi:hypothetical protein